MKSHSEILVLVLLTAEILSMVYSATQYFLVDEKIKNV